QTPRRGPTSDEQAGRFCVLPLHFHHLTLAPIGHNRSHTAAANKSRNDDNGHHRNNADHPNKIYEITRISTRMQLRLLKSGSQESSLEILRQSLPMLNEMRVRHDSAAAGRRAGASSAANGPRSFPPPYAHAPATPWDCRPAPRSLSLPICYLGQNPQPKNQQQ